MKKFGLVLLSIIILASGLFTGCGEGPPAIDDMVDYAKDVWKVPATADDIR